MARNKLISDIETHDGGYDVNGVYQPTPAVNIKLYHVTLDTIVQEARKVAVDMGGDPDDFATYVEEDEVRFQDAWDMACEDGVEDARNEAAEILGHLGAKVWQTGRSGGWLEVTGLPAMRAWDGEHDDLAWDDSLVESWAEWSTVVTSICDYVPRLACELLYLNAYQIQLDQEQDERDAEAELQEAKY